MKTNSAVRLERDGNEMAVRAGDLVLMRLRQDDMFWAGQFMLEDVRFHPESPVRMRLMDQCWLGIAGRTSPQHVRVLDEPTARGLRVRLEPELEGPVRVDDEYEFLPDPDSGGWMIDHACKLTLRRDMRADELGLHMMVTPEGVPTLHWEFDYLIPLYGAGPSVPMKSDWRGVYEPTLAVGPDTFRKSWRRAVTHYIVHHTSGKVKTLAFHRGLMCGMKSFYQEGMGVLPGGFAGFVCSDGAAVLLKLKDRTPLNVIICQWANDIHYRRPVPGDPEKLVLRKGHVLEASYRLCEVPAVQTRKLLRGAVPITAGKEDRKLTGNLPVYEEPVNHFRTSWADDPTGNAFSWCPGNGATWDRKVGRKTPGSLKLTATGIGFCYQEFSWKSCPVGSSTFMNPLVPNARYRLSGYVRVRPADPRFPMMQPTVSITFHKHAGFATFAPEIQPAEQFHGSIAGVRNPGAIRWDPDTWYKIEVVSGPITGNVLNAVLGCHLKGSGEAWFDELSFERIEEKDA
jgi:hypothetical protein